MSECPFCGKRIVEYHHYEPDYGYRTNQEPWLHKGRCVYCYSIFIYNPRSGALFKPNDDLKDVTAFWDMFRGRMFCKEKLFKDI